MVLFFLPIVLSFILIIWFDTDAFIEYTDLFKLYKIIPILKYYRDIREQGSDITFMSYLGQFYDNFWGKLMTCEICLSTWFGAISAILIFYYNYVTYGLLFAIFYGLALPYFVLLAYRIIKKLM